MCCYAVVPCDVLLCQSVWLVGKCVVMRSYHVMLCCVSLFGWLVNVLLCGRTM